MTIYENNPRRTKTSLMIQELKQLWKTKKRAILLVPTQEERLRIIKLFLLSDYENWIIAFDADFKKNIEEIQKTIEEEKDNAVLRVYVDNLDGIISEILGFLPDVVTVNPGIAS